MALQLALGVHLSSTCQDPLLDNFDQFEVGSTGSPNSEGSWAQTNDYSEEHNLWAVAGEFNSSTEFGYDPEQSDAFLRIMDSDFNTQWQVFVSGPNFQTINDVSFINDRVLVTGIAHQSSVFHNSTTLSDGIPGASIPASSNQNADAFVACYDLYSGNLMWQHTYGGDSIDVGLSVVSNGSKVFNCIAFDNEDGSVQINGQNVPVNQGFESSTSYAIMAHDLESGVFEWVSYTGSNGNDFNLNNEVFYYLEHKFIDLMMYEDQLIAAVTYFDLEMFFDSDGVEQLNENYSFNTDPDLMILSIDETGHLNWRNQIISIDSDSDPTWPAVVFPSLSSDCNGIYVSFTSDPDHIIRLEDESNTIYIDISDDLGFRPYLTKINPTTQDFEWVTPLNSSHRSIIRSNISNIAADGRGYLHFVGNYYENISTEIGGITTTIGHSDTTDVFMGAVSTANGEVLSLNGINRSDIDLAIDMGYADGIFISGAVQSPDGLDVGDDNAPQMFWAYSTEELDWDEVENCCDSSSIIIQPMIMSNEVCINETFTINASGVYQDIEWQYATESNPIWTNIPGSGSLSSIDFSITEMTRVRAWAISECDTSVSQIFQFNPLLRFQDMCLNGQWDTLYVPQCEVATSQSDLYPDFTQACDIDSIYFNVDYNEDAFSYEQISTMEFEVTELDTMHVITAHAILQDGSIDSCTHYLSVIDDFPISISGCGNTLQLSTPATACLSTLPEYDSAIWGISATDCDGSPINSVSTTPAIGADLEVGLHSVMVYFQGQNDVDSCQIYVQVSDGSVPVIQCSNSASAMPTDDGSCGATYYSTIGVEDCHAQLIDLTVEQYHNSILVNTIDNQYNLTNGQFTFTENFSLLVGQNTITYTAVDNFGNTSIQCQQNIEVYDDQSPTASCNSPVILTLTSDNPTASLTIDELNNNSFDNCAIDISLFGLDNSQFDTPGSFTSVLTVFDIYNNSSTCTTQVEVIDEISPIVICDSIQLDLAGNNEVILDDYIVLIESMSDNFSVPQFTNEQDFIYGCADIDTVHDITVIVADTSGNSSSCVSQVTIVNTEEPILECQNATFNVIDECELTETITAEVFYNCDATIQWDLAGTIGSGSSVTQPFGIGTDTIIWTLAEFPDVSCTSIVEVVDSSPHALECADTLEIWVTELGAIDLYPEMVDSTSLDDCAITSVQMNISWISDAIGIFEDSLILTVTDIFGESYQCATTVAIKDSIPPQAVCSPYTISLDTDGNASFDQYHLLLGESTDNSGQFNINNSATLTFGCDDIGPHPLTLSISDEEGNTDNCQSTVTVTNPLVPTIMCDEEFSDTVFVGCDVLLGPLFPVVDFNCEYEVEWHLTSEDGNLSGTGEFSATLGMGEHEIVWSLLGYNGIQCQQTIHVEDGVMPEIICPDTLSFCILDRDDVLENAPLTILDNCEPQLQQFPSTEEIDEYTEFVAWSVVDGSFGFSCQTYLDISHEADLADAGDDIILNSEYSAVLNATPIEHGFGLWTCDNPEVQLSDPNSSVCTVSNLSPGDQTFKWTVTNNGCGQSEDELTIKVNSFNIPTGFSPNGDQTNENFVIVGILNYPGNALQVWNRWGKTVYSATDYQNDWNGLDMNGRALSSDTYFYMLSVPGFEDQKPTIFKGFIELKR